jgi:predicted ATPase
MLWLSVLYGFWIVSSRASNGDDREVAAEFLALAEKLGTTEPLLVAHRLMGYSLLIAGEMAKARAHQDQAIALYDAARHRALAMQFGVDPGVTVLAHRSWVLWVLGYPEAALADADKAVNDARKIGHAGTLLNALGFASATQSFCGNDLTASMLADELVALADEKGAAERKALGLLAKGRILAPSGKAADAVRALASGLAAWQSMGATARMPAYKSHLGRAYAELGQFDDAWRCIGEALTAIDTTKERWFEAEVNRVAGEVVRRSPEWDAPKVEAYFEHALAVARQQHAKSWELRAAMSMAGLWRVQGKRDEARELLAPVYGWFTEGFDTRDLKEAKALLNELAA